ncbi:MAG TPA: GNAT family N-acetyltransferase [Acidimicrobiales bacterium]|nr:GNAT family N-acetyltransferase [Acidimicrobiales bacterium]
MSGHYPPALLLDWDTAFWDKRIARVSSYSPDSHAALESWADDNAIDCLYLTLDPAASDMIHLAESSGFRLMDVRLEFRQQLLASSGSSSPLVRSATPEDISALAGIARCAHGQSRFFADPQFPEKRCRDFYARWICESVRGFADITLLLEEVPGRVAGYVTGHVEDDTGRIGLIAVSRDAQGKGFATQLLNSMIGRFAGMDLRAVDVATQGSNRAARALYERSGFRLEDIRLVFHRWMRGQ